MKSRKFLRVVTAACMSLIGFYGIAQAQGGLITQYGTGTTTYSVVNTGTSNGTVSATYYGNPGIGSTPAGSGFTLPLSQNARLDITAGAAPDGLLPDNWSGSVVLASDQDIVAVAYTKYSGRPIAETVAGQSPGTESSAYEAFNSGSTEIFFPTLVRVKRASNPAVAQLSTRYTIQNTSGNTATVYLNYRNFDGTIYPPTVITLAGYGSRTFDTAVNADLPSGMNLTPNVIAFSARVTATQPIVGVAEQLWNVDGFIGPTPVKQNWVADYTAMPASEATTTLYVPLIARIASANSANTARPCTLGNYPQYLFFTDMSVQNTTANTATVTLEFIRANNTGSGAAAPSGSANFSHTVQIPPFGTLTLNTFAGGGFFPPNHPIWNNFSTPLPDGTTHCNWQGAARIVSNQPLVGYGAIQQPAPPQNYSSWYNLYGSAGATNKVVLPRVDRVCSGTSCGTVPTPVDVMDSFASVTVQNVGATTSTVTMTFFTAAGVLAHTEVYANVPAGGQVSYNTRATPGSAANLGNNFKGSVIATSDQPIRAFVNLLSRGDDADAYLGINR